MRGFSVLSLLQWPSWRCSSPSRPRPQERTRRERRNRGRRRARRTATPIYRACGCIMTRRRSNGRQNWVGAGYNNYYQIVQTPAYVGINMEMRHDTRMIPIGDRPHLVSTVHQWLGDSRGHWEGDTLVVETTNFRADAPEGPAGLSGSGRL